jgi:TonB family protein
MPHFPVVLVLCLSVACPVASAQNSPKRLPENASMARQAEELRRQREQYVTDSRYNDAMTLSSFDGCRSTLPKEHRARILEQGGFDYPDSARAAGQTGRVIVCVAISPAGDIERMGIIESSLVPVLDEAALKGIASWKFAAGKDESGNSTRDVLRIPLKFDFEEAQ